jgi:hypothetical protein
VEPEARDVPAEFPAVTGRAAERSLRAARVRAAEAGGKKAASTLNKATQEPEETAEMADLYQVFLMTR